MVLVSGPERFLADRVVRDIRQQLLAADPELEIHDVDATLYGAGELFTLASPSLFGEPRLIRVENVEKATDAFLEDAKRYIAEADASTTLVLRHAGGVRGKALLDTVRGVAGVAVGAIEIACPEMKKDTERLSFAQTEFQRLGAQAQSAAVRALVAAYGTDLAEIAGTIARLVANVGQRITESDVVTATEGRVEAGAFRVADAAIAGRSAEALELLRQSLSTGTDPIPMLAALNMKVRAMARVYGAQGSTAQLAKEHGMAPWQADRAVKDTRGWREADLAQAIDLAAETEWLLKGGTRDPEYALERYLLFIARKGPQR